MDEGHVSQELIRDLKVLKNGLNLSPVQAFFAPSIVVGPVKLLESGSRLPAVSDQSG